MKNLIKKNQLMITALAIMIAIAGYLQFAGTGLEDEYLEVTDGNVYTSEANLTGSGDIVTGTYTAQELLDLSEEDLLQTGVTDIESLDSDMEGAPVDDFLDVGAQITQNHFYILFNLKKFSESFFIHCRIFLKEQTQSKNWCLDLVSPHRVIISHFFQCLLVSSFSIYSHSVQAVHDLLLKSIGFVGRSIHTG